MKLTVEVPDDVSSEEVEELVKRYVERKERYEEFYKLIEFLRYFKDDAKRKRMKELLEGFFRVVSLDKVEKFGLILYEVM